MQRLRVPPSGGLYTHVLVRCAMYGVLLLLLVLGISRAVLSLQWQENRQLDLHILHSVSEQRVLLQRLSLLVPDPKAQAPDPDRWQALASTTLRLHKEADVLDQMQRRQSESAPLSSRETIAALKDWLVVREALWASLDRANLSGETPRTLQDTEVRSTMRVIARAEMTLYTLAQQLAADTSQRSHRVISTIWAIVGGILLLIIALAVFLVEPTARAVRRQYEELSRQAERLKRMATVAEISSNAIAITDASHRVTWINQAFTELTGYTSEAAQGRRIGTLLRGRSADPTHFSEFTEALAQGRGIKREVRILTRQGLRGWVLVDMQPIADPAGGDAGWVLVATDLSEVRSQQEILSLAVSGAGLGIRHWDLVDNSVGWNRRMQQFLGYPDGVLSPHAASWKALIHPDDWLPWKESIRQHLLDETHEHRLSVRLRIGPVVGSGFCLQAARRTARCKAGCCGLPGWRWTSMPKRPWSSSSALQRALTT